MKAAGWLLGATLCTLHLCTFAFKEAEFKKCANSNFCVRLRGNASGEYEVVPASVKVDAAMLVATLSNAACGVYFQLTLTAYTGMLRVHVDEPSAERKRHQVSLTLMEDIGQLERAWKKGRSARNSQQLNTGDASITLQYKPFKLEVFVGKQSAFLLNSRNMFQFEHSRTKQEGDPEGWWEETFKSFTDSKPFGPQAISLDLSFPGASNVYGIPDRGGLEAAEPFRMYNGDIFEYLHESNFGLYGSIPFMLAHRRGLTLGAFWLNSAEMYVDVEKGKEGTDTQWLAESGVLDLFLLLGPSPPQVLQQYGRLTGTTQMPQMFGIAYHQCRWNYRDQADVATVDATMDANDIPYDVIWLDIEHTDGKRYFTWDDKLFPDPVAMQESLAAHGRKLVTIVDPHIKRDPNYYIFKEAESRGFFSKTKDGKDFEGWCWPGSSSYLDMLNPEAVDWWATRFKLDNYKGSTKHLYVWNDMNEPSVFNGPEGTMQKDILHHGGVEHRDLHNQHGALFHRATALALQQRGKVLHEDGDRPFVLTRAFFAGSQRWGPMWTGDNTATWEMLAVSVPMLLSSGLSGYPFADVGGFFGNPDAELFTRWFQLGAYYPFMRGHAHLETARREPYTFGEPTTTRVRNAIRARYILLPYLYTLFQGAHMEGSPIMRALWYEFPDQEPLFTTDDVFMYGPALLVAPVLQQGATSRSVLLPGGVPWYDGVSGALVAKPSGSPSTIDVQVDMEGIPTFLRGGSIVPTRQRARRSSAAQTRDPFTLLVALDAGGHAHGQLYLDDGHSMAYERGIFSHVAYDFKGGVLSSSDLAPGNAFPNALQIEKIAIVGLGSDRDTWRVEVVGSGAALEVSRGLFTQRQGVPALATIVRKPGLPATGAWAIKFSKA